MKILITGGGSEEPIDNVRYISNFSTGKTASFLADYFVEKGFEVTAIMSEKAFKPCKKVKLVQYRTFSELKENMETECKNGKYQAVIHAAAVSDYSPYSVLVDFIEHRVGDFPKLPAGSELLIKMKKNPKLIDFIKQWTDRKATVIGFKLTSDAKVRERKSAVNKIFSSNRNLDLSPDFIVSNDLSEINKSLHPYRIYRRNLSLFEKGNNLQDLAESLERIVDGKTSV